MGFSFFFFFVLKLGPVRMKVLSFVIYVPSAVWACTCRLHIFFRLYEKPYCRQIFRRRNFRIQIQDGGEIYQRSVSNFTGERLATTKRLFANRRRLNRIRLPVHPSLLVFVRAVAELGMFSRRCQSRIIVGPRGVCFKEKLKAPSGSDSKL